MNKIILPLIVLGLTACSKPQLEPLCTARLKGRVVSTGPACAGIAIQILSGEYESDRVDAAWFNEYSANPITYQKTFTTYAYANSETDRTLLNIDFGQEFFFVFTNPEPGVLVSTDIAVCEPLVSLPEVRNEIQLVTQPCQDAITSE